MSSDAQELLEKTTPSADFTPLLVYLFAGRFKIRVPLAVSSDESESIDSGRSVANRSKIAGQRRCRNANGASKIQGLKMFF